MTSYSASLPLLRRWRDKRANPGSRTCQCEAVLQSAAHPDDRSELRATGGEAIKEQRTHIGYLEALLTMEPEERDRHAIQQRLRDAKLPG